jgi:hypothetical protein
MCGRRDPAWFSTPSRYSNSSRKRRIPRSKASGSCVLWQTGAPGWSFRRSLRNLARVCQRVLPSLKFRFSILRSLAFDGMAAIGSRSLSCPDAWGVSCVRECPAKSTCCNCTGRRARTVAASHPLRGSNRQTIRTMICAPSNAMRAATPKSSGSSLGRQREPEQWGMIESRTRWWGDSRHRIMASGVTPK